MLIRGKKFLFIVVLIFFLLIPSGCWDYTELDDNAYVIIIGFDQPKEANEEEEKRNAMDVTYMMANPQVGTSQIANISQGEKAKEALTFTAPDFVSSRDLANSFISRRISFSHLRMIVIGEEYAKNPESVNHLVELSRQEKIRNNTVVMITKEPASEFLRKNKPIFETSIHKFVQANVLLVKKTGLTKLSTFKDYLQSVTEAYSGYLIMYGTNEIKEKDVGIGAKNVAGNFAKTGGDTAEILGAAVVNKGRMVGTIEGNEVRLIHLIQANRKIVLDRSFPDPLDPNHFISLNLSKHPDKQVKYKINVDGPRLEIDVIVPLRLNLLSSPSRIYYIRNKENTEILRKAIAKQLKIETDVLIKKSQEELGDIFGFSLHGRTKFLTIPEWEAYDWKEKYKDAKINITFDCEFENFGTIIDPIQKGGESY